MKTTISPTTGKAYSYPRVSRRRSPTATLVATTALASANCNVDELIDRYRASMNWENLAASTRPSYWLQMKRLSLAMGKLDVTEVTRSLVEATYLSVSRKKGVGAGRTFAAVAKILFNFAVDRDLLVASPASRLKPTRGGTYPTMSRQTFEEAMAACPPWLQRAIWLTAILAQRRSDIAAMQWKHWDGFRFRFIQQKTKAKVSIKPQATNTNLINFLRGEPEEYVLGLHPTTDNPITAKGLSDAFRYYLRTRRIAGVTSGMNLHSLRKMTLTTMADSGVTLFELMAVSGHVSPKCLMPYIDAASRGARADNAMSKVPSLPFPSVFGETGKNGE